MGELSALVFLERDFSSKFSGRSWGKAETIRNLILWNLKVSEVIRIKKYILTSRLLEKLLDTGCPKPRN